MIDLEMVELQSEIMHYENQIYEAIQDSDWKKVEMLVIEYNQFRKANADLIRRIL